MSRQDYERIARVLRQQLDRAELADRADGDWDVRQVVVARIARDLAAELKADNERFDMRRFFRACGLDSQGGLW